MVTDCERVGQCVMIGQVDSCVVAHREQSVDLVVITRRGVGLHECVHRTLAPALVLGKPPVGDVVRALSMAAAGVEMEWQLVAHWDSRRVGRIWLRKRAKEACGVVVESPDGLVRAEVVIKRPILLHKDNYVLDGAHVRTGRGDRSSGFDARKSCTPGSEQARSEHETATEKIAAVDLTVVITSNGLSVEVPQVTSIT